MNTRHLLMCAAVLAVGFAWGYQRAKVAAVTKVDVGPVVGASTDWLTWQQQ